MMISYEEYVEKLKTGLMFKTQLPEEKVYFCGRLQSKNFKRELLWIHWIKNFGKNVKQL